MYTYTINKKEGNTAFVTLHNDTGETETYHEQVTVSDAIFATEDTPFIPPVVEIREHTRPKVIDSVITVEFTDDADLVSKIEEKIEAIVNPAPIPTAPEPTPEQIAEQEAMQARQEWFAKKSALSQMVEDTEKGRVLGIEPDAEQMAIMKNLATWINANMKQEYYF